MSDPAEGSPSKLATHKALHARLLKTLEFHSPENAVGFVDEEGVAHAFTNPTNDLIADVLIICAWYDEHRATRQYGVEVE